MIEVGQSQLHNGDAYEVLAGLDITADAIISDPPFGSTSIEWDQQGLDYVRFWELVEAKTKQEANYVLFGCGRFSFDLVKSKWDWFRYDIIWQKTTVMGFLNANLMPLRSHEGVYVFGQPGKQKSATYNPIKTHNPRNVGKTFGNRSQRIIQVYGEKETMPFVSDGWMNPRSVLTFSLDYCSRLRGNHPTQKPVALMEWLVSTYTNEGDIVIDPFMGSGTTGVACARLKRRFIGIEKSPEHFETAVARVSEESSRASEPTLFD